MADTAAATERPPVLRVSDVSKHFGGIRALDEVSLDVRAGEICGLIGSNGAGKTTLFAVISGHAVASTGRVWLRGNDITKLTPERRARAGIRRTFQRWELFGPLAVEDNVLIAMEWRRGGGGLLGDLAVLPGRRRHERERRERAVAALERCGVAHLRRAAAGSLTPGHARLVELARAIVDQPSLLLLDEPASGLAEPECEALALRIGELRDDGVAVVLVEHDVGFVMKHSDRIVVLDLGRVLATGTPEEIKAHQAVRTAYLG